jgi:uncharacterized membrane protein YfcA
MHDFSQLALDLLYGTVIGAALGLTGSGGSILATPVLVYLVGEEVHMATGTSRRLSGQSLPLSFSAGSPVTRSHQ